MTSQTDSCPLCGDIKTTLYLEDRLRPYFNCRRCQLVFVGKQWQLSAAEEKAVYDMHENSATNTGYCQFLNRITEPLIKRLPPGSKGLDFGCGPSPVLANLLTLAGMEMAIYDAFYFPDLAPQKFQFIVTTETVEHLSAPGMELQRLWTMIMPGGCLAIMTQRLISKDRFANWQYKNDPTHICFFSDATFRWLAEDLGASPPEFIGRDMVFIQKPALEMI